MVPPAPSLLRGTSVSHTGGQVVLAPQWRFVLNNLLVLRMNPVGLEDQMRIGLQVRLSNSTSRLLRDTFIFLGLVPRFNPAFIKFGPALEIQPLSIFNLRLTGEYIGFFSTFGFLQSFPSPSDEYDDGLLANCAGPSPDMLRQCRFRDTQGAEATALERRNYATSGFHLMIEPLLQAKLGPIALRNKLAFEYWYMAVRAGDTVFYDMTLDTLVPANGWILANDLDLLYVSRFGLVAGVRYSVVHPFYFGQDYRPGEDTTVNDNGHQRLGPILAYTFFDRGFTRFNKPTLLLIVNWYLDHRYRLGQVPSAILPNTFVQSAGMPYLVLGFSFQSDLITSR
ncbi:MAG: hypothetical protein RMK29_00505 [Myxococcales bacterium]|nr:hypothetical protein [Myxococcota bacterium]MDW8280157.1 hypothetical protein [Myxococcales bacterium]